MKIRTKADLIKDLEIYDDNAVIYYDEESARWYGDNYLFNVKNPTPLPDEKGNEHQYREWVQTYTDED